MTATPETQNLRRQLLQPLVPGAAPGCLVIGEVAQAHDGSLGLAHAFVDAIADAGADAVKFQTHIAAEESTPSEPWRVRFSPQDERRYDYWRRMELNETQWRGLKEHAESRGLLFLSSPFSLAAADLLDRLGIAAWKVASGEVSEHHLLRRLADTGKPILLSTGMSDLDEIDAAVALVRHAGAPVALFQCTTAYPCPPEQVGLEVVDLLRDRYRCPVGLSDHSGTIYPGLAGVARGLDLLEVHVTLSREMFGPDVPASVTTAELRQLVEGIRFIERMHAHPVDKQTLTPELDTLKRTFGKSVVARRDLAAGTVLDADDLALKKPGTGLPPAERDTLLGRRLACDVSADTVVLLEHLEPTS